MGKVKEGDFISLDYVGTVKDTGQVFDLTDEGTAKQEGVYDEEADYSPATIVVGAGHVVEGLDQKLVGLKENETKEFIIEPEDAFGRRDGQLIKLVPLKVFTKRDVRPYPGMRVNFQGAMGQVKSVESGRVMVDFNHPLAGKKLKYKVTVNNILKKPEHQISGLMKLHAGLKEDEFKISKSKDKFKIEVKKELPKFVEEKVSEELKKYAGIERPKFVY